MNVKKLSILAAAELLAGLGLLALVWGLVSGSGAPSDPARLTAVVLGALLLLGGLGTLVFVLFRAE
jgi:hypothetical protein